MFTFTNTIDLEKAGRLVKQRGKELIKKYAFQIERETKTPWPIDTGFSRNAIHVVFEDDGLSAWIIAAADYSIWIEIGARNRPGLYLMTRSFEAARPEFFATMRELFR